MEASKTFDIDKRVSVFLKYHEFNLDYITLRTTTPNDKEFGVIVWTKNELKLNRYNSHLKKRMAKKLTVSLYDGCFYVMNYKAFKTLVIKEYSLFNHAMPIYISETSRICFKIHPGTIKVKKFENNYYEYLKIPKEYLWGDYYEYAGKLYHQRYVNVL